MSNFNNDPFNTPFFQAAQKRFEDNGGFNAPFFKNAMKIHSQEGLNGPFKRAPKQDFLTNPLVLTMEPEAQNYYRPVQMPQRLVTPTAPPKANVPAPKIPSLMGELEQTLANKKSTPPRPKSPKEPPKFPPMPPQDPPKEPGAATNPAPRALPVPPVNARADSFESEFNDLYLNIEKCLPLVVEVITAAMYDRAMYLDRKFYELAQVNKTLRLIKEKKDINELNKLKEHFKECLGDKSETKPISMAAKCNLMRNLLGYNPSADTSLLKTLKSRLSDRDEPKNFKQIRIRAEEDISSLESSYKLFFHELVKSMLKSENISEGDPNYEIEFETVYFALNKSFHFKVVANEIDMGLNNQIPHQPSYALFHNEFNSNRAYNYN